MISFAIHAGDGESFAITTHGNRYDLARHNGFWVLSCKSGGGHVAPSTEAGYAALGCALRDLACLYAKAQAKRHARHAVRLK